MFSWLSFLTSSLNRRMTVCSLCLTQFGQPGSLATFRKHMQTYFFSEPVSLICRWLAVRLEFVGNIITFLSALFAIVAKDSISSGLAGLSISYAMQVFHHFWLLSVSHILIVLRLSI